MIYPEVDKLYKYQSYSTNSIASLVNKVNWAARPRTFNDPFDCAVSFIPDIDPKTFLKLLIEEAENNSDTFPSKAIESFENALDKELFGDKEDPRYVKICNLLAERFRDLVQDIGVVSLSEINDHILMWSHYAEQHKGFCIEYDRNPSNLLGDNNTLPVRYTNRLPVFSLQSIVSSDLNNRKEYMRSLVLSKAQEWSYENEWRFINSRGDCLVELNADITAIIFGARMPQEHKSFLSQLLARDNQDIKLKQVELKADGFGLEIVDYKASLVPLENEPKKRKLENILNFDL
ncbi:DUF2971 domain-containing protein [Vibrio coralliilyticus]|uniref:DUF2971 domain-containing protein n=1 Tax=Vibrio coralliilyticus TaxID=190893 RepID=UPI001560DF0A|nr:DUF2971 domain-containing protein [Vibrio coralliilyticus]NRF55509.1 DUF2971 domain-containing protein [Vibrio coralliilyticus]